MTRRKSAIVIKCRTPTCKARLFIYDPSIPYDIYCPRCTARRARTPQEVVRG